MKISGYPPEPAPASSDYVLGNKASGPTTERFLLSDLITLFLNNIPAAEGGNPFVSSNLVWTADAAGSTRAASMTAGRVRVNTSFLSISAVTARVFTASKDTYIDVLDNADGSGTIVYTEVTNNAASPSLAANSIRLAIIVTGASNIATAASINQGQEDRVLPIASSITYTVTDSIGNLICPRDPNHTLIGYRQTLTPFSTSSSSATPLTPLSIPVLATVGRKLEVFLTVDSVYNDTAQRYTILTIWDGTVGSGTKLGSATSQVATSTGNQQIPLSARGVETPAVSSKTINIGINTAGGAGNSTVNAGSGFPAIVTVKQT